MRFVLIFGIGFIREYTMQLYPEVSLVLWCSEGLGAFSRSRVGGGGLSAGVLKGSMISYFGPSAVRSPFPLLFC